MLKMVFQYRPAIDDITANKSLKLWHYELDDEDWLIIKDLLRVLKVCLYVRLGYWLTFGS